ncbi:Not1-domain-containing protein [Ceraceosorus guamensis]|uniref:General negative regulator of transcription subunit 1 n=1 Tax=Ceraceosorus guamensis TaxID=1522189 RepID=A0A316VUX0_9BASI|nr:Not1-domain-containing protein [Ceraceosorus guamensis]PWN39305.1 Not1-domain-containing protein [Ceraceosorus guamensis]
MNDGLPGLSNADGRRPSPSPVAILDQTLSSLGNPSDLTSGRLAATLVLALSDQSEDTPSVLERPHQRALIRAVAERISPDVLIDAVMQALPDLSFLADVGPAGVPKVEVARAILSRFRVDASPVDERTVAEILAGLLVVQPEELGGAPATDFAIVASALRSFTRSLNWSRVVRSLDEAPSLAFSPRNDWRGFASFLNSASNDPQAPAVLGLWGAWIHRLRQLQILSGLVSLDIQLFSFASLPGRRVVREEDVTNVNATVRSLAQQVQGNTWNSLDLVETLTLIANTDDTEVRHAVTELLEKAVKTSAELVLMALVQIPQPWTSMHSDLASKLLSMFLSGHPSHQLVFSRLWQTNRTYLLNAFRTYYSENPMNVTRLLDVAQDLKILEALLAIRPFQFALDVAALASRREYLNLDKWLQDQITENGSAFVQAALQFVDSKAKDDLAKKDPQAEQQYMPLTVQTVATFLRVMRQNGDTMSAEDVALFKTVRNLCLQVYPRLMNLAPGSESLEPGLQVTTFAQDIHDEADSWYRKMYEDEIGIEDLVSLLQRTKASSDARDHQVFACMVHTLFDEYRWFDLYYPPRELAMTAVVFGSLIQHQLIDYIPLGIAIRYVLDALREPIQSSMFQFGLQALLRFRERLAEWPQLGQALLGLPAPQQAHPEIERVLRTIQSGQLADLSQSTSEPVLPEMPGETPKLSFTAVHADPMPDADVQEEPTEEVSDKILFIINNLSPSNIESKLVEARRLVKPALHHWLSAYLVLQRVSIEPNNHELYTQFIDGLDSAATLLRHILHETLSKVEVLLNSDKTVSSTTERTLLKNLASWLGGLTLARNKPIRHRNIAFKDLLIQGYDSNRLIVAIPFVCKLLEQCPRSKVFVPPNPWLMSVLKLLAELYHFAELKLNLKFEIEVLCKTLSIDLTKLESTTTLRTRPDELAAAAQLEMEQQQHMLEQQRLQQQRDQQHLQQQQQFAARQQQPHQLQQGPYGQQPNQQQLQYAQQQQRLAQPQHMHPHQGQQQGAQQLAQDFDRLSMANAGTYGPGGMRTMPNDAQRSRVATLASQQQQQQISQHHQQHALLQQQQQQQLQQPQQHAQAQREPQQAPAAGAQSYSESLELTLQNLSAYLVFSPQLSEVSSSPALKQIIHVAIERAIREITAPVVERSVTIASISSRELVLKDFAMEGDEEKMRKAAHQMSQNLAGSLALVTCKEPLRISMVTQARSLLAQSGVTEQALPESVLTSVMGDNLELACSIVERAAMDKALPEVDSGLDGAYAARRDHRARSRGYYWDSQALTTSQYVATLPDYLRLKPEGLLPEQLRVYDDFGKTSGISSPDAPAERDQPSAEGNGVSPQSSVGPGQLVAGSLSPQQSLERFNHLLSELERLLQQASPAATLASLPPDDGLRNIIRQVPILAAASTSRDATAFAFSHKVVQLLYKSESRLAREAHVLLLERLCELSARVAKEVTQWIIYAEDERKFNVPVAATLIRTGIVNIVEHDQQLAKLILRDFKSSVVDFSARLALECLKEPACATRGQLMHSLDALAQADRLGKSTEASAFLLSEIETGRLTKAQTDVTNSALREQLAYCFAEWVRLFQQSPNPEKVFVNFVTQLQQQGILKGEDISSMFYRVCTEVGVDSYIKQKALGGTFGTGIFSPIDAFSKLVVLLIKHHSDPSGTDNEQARAHYLTKILSIIVLVLAQSHEELGAHFQQKPFFRLFSSLLHDFHAASSSLGNTYMRALLAIANTLNTLQPSFFPGFTFSWMALTSHRLFMPKLLGVPLERDASRVTLHSEAQAAFLRLYSSLLHFAAPFIRTAVLQDTSRELYRGLLRITLVLLHDFPDFLSTHHQALCDGIPISCVQLRNVVLAAYPPRRERLPDPFTASVTIDRLPEAAILPIIPRGYTHSLEGQSRGFKSALDSYLGQRAPASFLSSLKTALFSPVANSEPVDYSKGELRYDYELINAFVLHVGIAAAAAQDGLLNSQPRTDVGLVIFRHLMADADAEGRYLVLTAAANQLRYPNRHTAYFSCLLLHLYGETTETDVTVQEQIARVLIERMVAARPHPWGLLMTAFELLRNPRFVLPQNAPREIELMLRHMRADLTQQTQTDGQPDGRAHSYNNSNQQYAVHRINGDSEGDRAGEVGAARA